MKIDKEVKIHLKKSTIRGENYLPLLHKLLLMKSIEFCTLAGIEPYVKYKDKLSQKLKILSS